MWNWLKERWKAVVGAVLALMGGLLTLFHVRANSQKQKEILKNANDSHKAELDIIKDTQNRIDAGLDEIAADAERRVEKIEREAEGRREDLKEERREFVEDARESDDLAREIADAIGADFVEPSNK
jgi:tRNA uridine 5-carbamoylmethylation protein Kti12